MKIAYAACLFAALSTGVSPAAAWAAAPEQALASPASSNAVPAAASGTAAIKASKAVATKASKAATKASKAVPSSAAASKAVPTAALKSAPTAPPKPSPTPTVSPSPKRGPHPKALRDAKFRSGSRFIIRETAHLLEIPPEQLIERLSTGTTLAELARERKGWSEEVYVQKLAAAANERIDAAVRAGRWNREEAERLKTRLPGMIKQRIHMRGSNPAEHPRPLRPARPEV
ncbi:hypothetical protein [Paenibacillus nanchangensis]|uniref:hypothetical protein n=1 Tax=Paenibacillus nanchangensis TaxID=3348343 RepID=UPI00397E4BE6